MYTTYQVSTVYMIYISQEWSNNVGVYFVYVNY